MKKFNFMLFAFLLFLSAGALRAQDGPYLEAQYDVQVTLNQPYGVNATILPLIFQQSTEAIPRPLVMDIYEPVGDDNTARPVMLVFHTGNFLPFPQNNGTGGTKSDSTVVEVCNRLAQRGFVACAIDYRLGWNPIDPSQDIRKFFLINAAYRGVQDTRTAVRYMRKLAQDENNPYNIDPERIGTWGIGTGGYIVAANATLEQYAEIVVPKFLIDLGTGPVPMVIEGVNGNLDGTTVGIVPPGYPVLPAGDTLCYPNHVTYEDGTPIPSDISFTVNNGGALGDISWIDEETKPWVSFHVPTDPFAPYTTGTLTVPGTGDPDDPTDDFAVVEVSGSYDIQAELSGLGTNDLFSGIPDAFIDFSEVADSRNDGYEGLFPFPTDDPLNSAPWDFYALDNPNADDPPADPVVARTYWDTVFAYVGPRACLAMDLPCNLTSLERLDAAEIGLKVMPNPATSEVQIVAAPEYTIKAIEMYDVNGRLVQTFFDINHHTYQLPRGTAPAGMYFLKLRMKEGIAVQRLIFK